MPYTTPLDRPPPLPNVQAPIATQDGRPTKEFAAFLNAQDEFNKRVYAALVEIEAVVFP